MKRLIIGTMTMTMVLSTAVYANDTVEVRPISADLTNETAVTTGIDVTPNIGILPIEMPDTNGKVISYIPKAPNDSVTVEDIGNAQGHFDSPTNVWEISYTGKNEKTATLGYIEEYNIDTFKIEDVNTDIYDVFTSEDYVYVASPNMGRVLYFPDSSVDTMTYEAYQEDLINFLVPYKLDTDVAVQGINSDFSLSLPDELELSAYNVDEYNDSYLDAISFVYQPANRMDMPQEIFKLTVSEEQPTENSVKVLDANIDIYIDVNTNSDFATEMDNIKYDEYISFITANDYANIKNNLQVPQIQEPITEKDEKLVVDGVITDIEYINVGGGRKVIPVRDTFEYLGYDVVWNDETDSVDLINGPMYSSVTIGEDSYAFGKMAPINLGLPPMLIDETTYVPIEILTQVFPYEYQINSNGYLSLVTE